MVLTSKKKKIYGLGPNGSIAHHIVTISPSSGENLVKLFKKFIVYRYSRKAFIVFLEYNMYLITYKYYYDTTYV